MTDSSRESIKKYLLVNPIDRSKPNCYSKAAKHFGVDSEVVRRVWRSLRDSGLVENNNKTSFKSGINGAEITQIVNERVTTLEDLIRVCNIDTDQWTISRWECNKWEVGASTDKGVVVTPLFQVKAKLEPRKLDTDILKQKEFLLKELKAYSPKYDKVTYKPDQLGAECLLELSLFDLHFGKLAHKDESGEDYDLKIAEKRFKTAVKELLKRTNLKIVDRIFLPIGNDLINIDNLLSTTTAGTPQDTDTRFHKIVTTVKRVLIETIDELSQIAPVDIVIVPGNHDTTVTFMLGEILDAWYFNNPQVTIDNTVKLRKYYKFGKNSFQLTHGDREKHVDLGLIFASEEPKLWAATKHRFCQLGHFHKSKKINYISVDTHQGFQIQIMPSLSANDAWHTGKGYNSLKQAKAFLFHPTEGLIGEYTYTV